MSFRSALFTPGDSARKIDKARTAGADVVILDLEDSVAAALKAEARERVADVLAEAAPRAWRAFVRVNPFDTGLTLADLAAVVRPGLAGIVLPKTDGLHDVVRLGHCLDALETRAGMEVGATQVLVVATETPAAMFGLGSYAAGHPRLCGLTWGAEDLGSAVGATANKEADGAWTEPYRLARSQCLFAAVAAGVSPIETLFADFRDVAGLEADCRRSFRDGFTGRLAIHPDQVASINACFRPSEEEVAFAQRLVGAFEARPDAGTVGLDGKMYDIPHLKAARRTLARASHA